MTQRELKPLSIEQLQTIKNGLFDILEQLGTDISTFRARLAVQYEINRVVETIVEKRRRNG